MRQATHLITVATRGPGFTDFTHEVRAFVDGHAAQTGLLTLFVRHTSASLLIQENADPDVLYDLEMALQRLAPRGRGLYRHDAEGPDDMPAHIRAALTQSNLAVPIHEGRLMLGTWQGIYLAEHRDRPHRREVALHLMME